MDTYDLVVIGTGPAGHFGAIQAAKLGKRVAAVESHPQLGGACAITGTIPSKALREATMHLTGLRQRTHYGMHYRVKDHLTVDDLTMSTQQVIRHEVGVLDAQLRRNGVELIEGDATFIGPHEIRVEKNDVVRRVRSERVLVACGSRPARPPGMDFDGERIIDSNQILHLDELPRSLIVVGAGVIGVEYACIFATLGVRVTLVNESENFLEFVDREIVETLKYHMQSRNVDFRLGEEVTDVERMGDFVVATTRSNKKLAAECLLYSIGRQGNTDRLAVAAAGVGVDHRGRIEVNEDYQTKVPHIYAAGDVVGFPSLAATSREQGRRAVCHAFGVSPNKSPSKFPYGIYAIPEISMIGPTEQELTKEGIPYEIGRARYREIARGQILGDVDGMLKILFERDTRRVLAVHIIGEGATELIHIGQVAEAFGATLDYFVNTVFNYPTLAECYKVAALDGINRVRLLAGIIDGKGRVREELQTVVDRAAPPSGVPSPETDITGAGETLRSIEVEAASHEDAPAARSTEDEEAGPFESSDDETREISSPSTATLEALREMSVPEAPSPGSAEHLEEVEIPTRGAPQIPERPADEAGGEEETVSAPASTPASSRERVLDREEPRGRGDESSHAHTGRIPGFPITPPRADDDTSTGTTGSGAGAFPSLELPRPASGTRQVPSSLGLPRLGGFDRRGPAWEVPDEEGPENNPGSER